MIFKGLILSGGKSSRLGYDKFLIKWHGLPHYQYLLDLLSEYCDDVYVSANQPDLFSQEVQLLPDLFQNIGPIAGIHSALKHDPDAHWIVLPADLPMVSSTTVDTLRSKMDPGYSINYGYNRSRNSPEPLVSIWNGNCLPDIESRIRSHDYSIRSILASVPSKGIDLEEKELVNVNTPEEYYQVKSMLPYVPVDCNYYDRIEVAAMKKDPVEIRFYVAGTITEISDRIRTIRNQDHTEYLVLEQHAPIRLDLLVSIEGHPNPIS